MRGVARLTTVLSRPTRSVPSARLARIIHGDFDFSAVADSEAGFEDFCSIATVYQTKKPPAPMKGRAAESRVRSHGH
jgi:hypothetical protein